MADEDFNLSDFKIVESRQKDPPKAARLNKRTQGRGPIRGFFVASPLAWESEAARLPGKTLHVARALRYLCGLTKTTSGIRMQSRVLTLFGTSHQSYNRCLKRLESAGLVSVERRPGQTPIVSILDE
jgi:hypothetical protein